MARNINKFSIIFTTFLFPLSGKAYFLAAPDTVPVAPAHHAEALLPDLGSTSVPAERETKNKFSTLVNSLGQSLKNSNQDTISQRKDSEWLVSGLRDSVTSEVNNTGQNLLSALGHAQLAINVNNQGKFTGSTGSLLTPWYAQPTFLTYSQLSINQSTLGTLGSAGIGQRFSNDQWLFGYHAFLDHLFATQQQRESFGLELWNHFLRLSANYYAPLDGWRARSLSQEQRLARGYDISSQSYLPFYQQMGITFNWQQYLGENIDQFNNGNLQNDPRSMSVGVTFTPLPLVTFTAAHKMGTGGVSQDLFGLNINYHFGQSLAKQLSPSALSDVRSLYGSRYDIVTRNRLPVMSYRKKAQSLSVFLATPPWQLNSGDSVDLIVQITPKKAIKSLSWQGDTRQLSLTPPQDSNGLTGWTIILPAWNDQPGASNQYHLAVKVDDGKQQVISNTITLSPQRPINNHYFTIGAEDPSQD